MVTMTSSATEKVQDFIQEHGVESDAGLRVAVLPGGCSGFEYGLNVEDGPEADDEVLDVNLPESQGERRLWVQELVHGLTLCDNRHP